MRKLFATIFAAALSLSFVAQAADAPASKRPYPKHELDASWPKQFPNNMIMGDPAGGR